MSVPFMGISFLPVGMLDAVFDVAVPVVGVGLSSFIVSGVGLASAEHLSCTADPAGGTKYVVPRCGPAATSMRGNTAAPKVFEYGDVQDEDNGITMLRCSPFSALVVVALITSGIATVPPMP